MKLAINSILSYALKTEPGCRQDRHYIEAINSYLDGIDMSIIHYLAIGKDRDNVAELLCRTRRTVEQRLQKLRAMFGCKNTTHLMATLAFIPMSINKAFVA